MTGQTAKIKAYIEQVRTGKATGDQADILRTIMGGPKSLYWLRDNLGMPHQTVTARCSDLEQAGVIYKHRHKGDQCSTYYFESNELKQLQRRQQIEYRQRRQWVEKGLRKGWLENDEGNQLVL